ncbi:MULTISPECIES: nitroreductase/quinone reductase family protein [unclassified Frankia]|uniref:nitroreductase/quinone reductase family protein n=1 Tax=unclassified Frankia TaxID=2632575 RepID=UPI001EE41CB3|nr:MULTISPECIES: nitroreductase/quinone reductase family protein [unclassified Frankia]
MVLIRDGDTIRSMVAREAAGAEKARLWETADAAWPHFPEYRANTTREIPLLVLEPPR